MVQRKNACTIPVAPVFYLYIKENAMDYIAQPKDYWIAPNAIRISLNTLGDANRIQCSVASGAVIMCYIYGTANDGLGYDNGHQYRTWPIVIAPTYFNTNTQKYVYVAIPKNQTVGTTAMVVFPSEQLDIYGKNASDEQIGSTDYFFIWLQGIVSEVRENDSTLERQWTQNINYGLLDTDQARDAKTDDTSWYSYSNLTEIVTFLKEIVMNVGSSFRNLFLGGKELTSVATDNTTPADSTTAIVTPAYSSGKYLSKIDPDAAASLIQFLGGLTTGDFHHGSTGASIDSDGNAEFASAYIRGLIQAAKIITDYANSSDFFKGQLGGSGWGIYKDSNGHSTMELDNLIVRMKAVFAELEIRKMSYIGGDYIFSAAGSVIAKVEYLDEDGEVLANTEIHPLVDADGNYITQDGVPVVWKKDVEVNDADIKAFRCYVFADDGTTRTENWWQVNDQARCQTFNIKTGVYENVANRYYWRLVTGIGSKVLEDGHTYNYVDLSNEDYDTNSGISNDYPLPGDAIVQLGNRTDQQRQNAIEIVVEGDAAPAFIEYKGISTYELAPYQRTVLSPNGDILVAKSFEIATENGPTFRIPVERGEWLSTDKYYYYDRVSHNGSLWLCVIEDGTHKETIDGQEVDVRNYTTVEPAVGAIQWQMQVSGGTPGTPGQDAPTMVCSPSPVMVETDYQRKSVAAWTQDVEVKVYVQGLVRQLQSINIDVPPGLGWTANSSIVNGNGKISISGATNTVINEGSIGITAVTQVGSVTAKGSLSVSPSKNGKDGTDGNDGYNAASVWFENETYFINTNSEGYPLTNIYTDLVFKVMIGDEEMEIVDVSCTPFVQEIGGEIAASVDIHDYHQYEGTIGVIWRNYFPVRSVDVPITIEYIDSTSLGDDHRTITAMFSVRKVENGANGQSAYWLSVSPTSAFFEVDDEEMAPIGQMAYFEIRGFVGSQQVNVTSIDNIQCDNNEIYFDEFVPEKERNSNLYYGLLSYCVDKYQTFDDIAHISFDVEFGDGYMMHSSCSIAPLRKGERGNGITSITIEYAISDQGNTPPSTGWAGDFPAVGQREYLWTRTTIRRNSGNPSVSYAVVYQGGDGDNGTSFTVKGNAKGHFVTKAQALSYATSFAINGYYLIDEGDNAETSVIKVTDADVPEYEDVALSNGDAYLVDNEYRAAENGHLFVATDDGWIDAGQIKGDDGAPAYIHYAWANSYDGTKDFRITKNPNEDFIYMGVCADHSKPDPTLPSAYTWNKVRGAEGDKGTTILGTAKAYYNDTTIGGNPSSKITETGLYLIDFKNWKYANKTWTQVSGSGVGVKVLTYNYRTNTCTFADPDVGDSYIVGKDLYTYIGVSGDGDDETSDAWVLVMEDYKATSSILHYAWADFIEVVDGSVQATGFTTTKGIGESKAYMGFYSDEILGDSQNANDYTWTKIKGENGNGISSIVIAYGISQSSKVYPTNWYASIEALLQAIGATEIPEMHYLWVRTTITDSNGNQSVSYAPAYQGKEGSDGKSVNLKGTVPTESDLYNINNPSNGDGYVVEETGHLWVYTDGQWHDVGKFSGDNGKTTYMHIAWGNDLIFENNVLVRVDGFTTSKAENEDFAYMGVCTDFTEADPSGEGADLLYTWNKIRGAEGSRGTAIKGNIIAHILYPSSSYTELGLYAVEATSQVNYQTPSKRKPCLMQRGSNNSWTVVATNFDEIVGNNIDEGDSYLDKEGHLWSYIEDKWEDLGKYTGDGAYLHFAWANSPTGQDGFTTSKTNLVDYLYVGMCTTNDEQDPDYGYGTEHPTEPWKYYQWNRLMGLSPAEVDLGTEQVVANADSNGIVAALSDFYGLPSSVMFKVDGKNVPRGSWTDAKVRLIYSNSYKEYTLGGTISNPNPSGLYLATVGTLENGYALNWAYAATSSELALRQIRVTVSATNVGYQYTSPKTLTITLNKAGANSDFRVQYSVGKDANDNWNWHDVFAEGDKWMRIFENGAWGRPVKIVADEIELNVKGSAAYHVETTTQAHAKNKLNVAGLVDTYTKSGSTKHSGVITCTGSGSSAHNIVDTEIGDGYILRDEDDAANGHLFIASDDGWQDIGQIAGANGKDALVATLSPPNAILNQDIDTRILPTTSFRVVMTYGTRTIPFGTGGFSIGTPIPSQVDGNYTCAATRTNDVIKVQVMTYRKGTENIYYDNGYVDVPISYQGYSTTLRFNWYANLLGTWRQTIIGDVNKSIATRLTWEVDEDTDEIFLTTDNNDFTISATLLQSIIQKWKNSELVSQTELSQTANSITLNAKNYTDNQVGIVQVLADGILQEVVNARGGYGSLKLRADAIEGMVNDNSGNISSLLQTANGLASTVQHLQVGATNMFSFTEIKFNTSDGMPQAIPYIQGYGIEGRGSLVRIYNLGTESVGGDFVVTCEMKMLASSTTINVNMCDVNPTRGLGSVPIDAPTNGAFTLGTEWVAKTFVFSVPNNNQYIHPYGSSTYNGFLDFEGSITDGNRLHVRNLKVERGRVATAFNISDKDIKAYNSNDVITLVPNELLTKESSKYKGYDVYKLPTSSFGSGNKDLFTNGAGQSLTTGKVYTMSFYARGNGVMIGNFFYGSTNPVNNPVDGSITSPDLSTLASALRAGEMTALNQADGATYIKLSSTYKRYTIHWYNQNSGTRHVILGRVNSSWQMTAADVYITGIEFREGYWTEEQMESQSMIQQTASEIRSEVENLEEGISTEISQTANQIKLDVKNGLNSTGINIEDGNITLNADKTTIVGDLELHDQEQGLVLYDGGNVAKVSVKSDTLGNLDPNGFGTLIYDQVLSIVSDGAATFNFSLGNVAVGESVEITNIRVIHGLANVSGSVRYSYSLKVGGTTKSSSNGQVAVGVYGFSIPAFGITSNASGALALVLSITNATMLNTRELKGTAYARTTATGLNKIGADGAVFANSQTHYNWFGSDQTEIRNGAISLGLDSNGAWYSPYSYAQKMELGSCTTVAFVSRNDSGVNSLGNNTYEWFASLSMGLIVISESYTFNIYLPDCHVCRGKIFYVKRLAGNVTVFMNNSQGNPYLIPSDSGASDATDRISMGSRASMFISAYDYWLEFDCS